MGATWHGVPIERTPIEGGSIDPEVVEYVRRESEARRLRARMFSPALDHVLGMVREGGQNGGRTV